MSLSSVCPVQQQHAGRAPAVGTCDSETSVSTFAHRLAHVAKGQDDYGVAHIVALSRQHCCEQGRGWGQAVALRTAKNPATCGTWSGQLAKANAGRAQQVQLPARLPLPPGLLMMSPTFLPTSVSSGVRAWEGGGREDGVGRRGRASAAAGKHGLDCRHTHPLMAAVTTACCSRCTFATRAPGSSPWTAPPQ